jgi:hypothetical protein
MFPEPLRRTAPSRWRVEADFALDYASEHARRGDRAACVGKCAYAIIAAGHARLAADGIWAVNEKGLVRRSGLQAGEDYLPEILMEPTAGKVDQLHQIVIQGSDG